MLDCRKFYIDGQWLEPQSSHDFVVTNPATEQQAGVISLGGQADVDLAVQAAKKAFVTFSKSPVNERVELLKNILAIYNQRAEEMAQRITAEMGAPISWSRQAQVGSAGFHLKIAAKLLASFEFEKQYEGYRVHHEPIGVCGMITPWNWPANQIMCKIAPALAAGCTIVLKPSEMAPLSAHLIAEIIDEAGAPAGVFNLVNGDGPGVGNALSLHPDIAMMSFTGSTRAGIAVAQSSATTVKRVTQELGGKSANIILDDADLKKAVAQGVMECMANTGQTCLAPTRMLVPAQLQEQVVAIAAAVANKIVIGDTQDETTTMGPLASSAQFEKVQGLIDVAIKEGATLVCGGLGKPEGFSKGFYTKPTIFSDVTAKMTIAQEEVFGPVLSIIPYENEAEAIEIANDSPYGLAGYIQSADDERALQVARQLQTGYILINGAFINFNAPLAGHKQSGNGAEWGEAGLDDYLLKKSVVGVA